VGKVGFERVAQPNSAEVNRPIGRSNTKSQDAAVATMGFATTGCVIGNQHSGDMKTTYFSPTWHSILELSQQTGRPMKRLVIALLGLALFLAPTSELLPQHRSHSSSSRSHSSTPRYSGSRHTGSHGGHYSGGSGSSHKGGHYRNSRTGNRYGHHK
jgi:hypothetical protein